MATIQLGLFWRQLACEGHPYLHRGELWVDLPVSAACLKFVTILLTLPASFSGFFISLFSPFFFFSLFHFCSFSLSGFSSFTFKFWVLSLGCLPQALIFVCLFFTCSGQLLYALCTSPLGYDMHAIIFYWFAFTIFMSEGHFRCQ